MTSVNKITQTLEQMVEANGQLLELVREKRDLLIAGTVTGLQSVTYQESLCAEEIQKLELERQQLIKEYMAEQRSDGEAFTLEEVINVQTDDTYKRKWNNIAIELRQLIKEISYLNENNQQLIQTSLSYIQYTIGLHVQKEPSVGYGPKSSRSYSSLLDAKI